MATLSAGGYPTTPCKDGAGLLLADVETDTDGAQTLPTTPMTLPATPMKESPNAALEARATALFQKGSEAPAPTIDSAWPGGLQSAPALASAEEDEALWQAILVRFGATLPDATRTAQHFMDAIAADPRHPNGNSVPFPKMPLRFKSFPEPESGFEAGVKNPDDVTFPVPGREVEEPKLLSSAVVGEREAWVSMVAGRAESPEELRKAMYSEEPLDMELTPWPMRPDGVIAADECTKTQLAVWEQRAKKCGSRRWEAALAKRRQVVLAFNPKFFNEIMPELEHEASLLEMKARWASDRAQEAKQYDDLAEQGALVTAWPEAYSRQWPAPPTAWKRFSTWFKKWRATPRDVLVPKMERSNSLDSLKSWLSVSDISWVDVEAQASADVVDPEFASKTPGELMEEARVSLYSLGAKRKADLQELKALAKPPGGVHVMCSCFMYLLAGVSPQVALTKQGNAKDVSWKGFQALCSNPTGFLNELKEFPSTIDAGKVPRKNIEKVRQVMIVMGAEFSPDNLKKKSAAAAGLCTWLQNICAYYTLAAPAEVPAAAPAPTRISKTPRDVQNGFLCKGDIIELKSLSKPPCEVAMVMEVVGILVEGREEMDWAGCKRMLLDATLLKRLLTFDMNTVPPASLAKAKKLVSEPSFDVDIIKSKSAAAVGLAKWVLYVLENTGNARDGPQ